MRDPAAQNYEILRKRLNKSEVIEKLYHVTSNKEKKKYYKILWLLPKKKKYEFFWKKEREVIEKLYYVASNKEKINTIKSYVTAKRRETLISPRRV